jgi:hypothetical protein
MERGVSQAGICYTADTGLSTGACSDQLGMTQSPFWRENSLLFARGQNLLLLGFFVTENCINTVNIFDKAVCIKTLVVCFTILLFKFCICEFH